MSLLSTPYPPGRGGIGPWRALYPYPTRRDALVGEFSTFQGKVPRKLMAEGFHLLRRVCLPVWLPSLRQTEERPFADPDARPLLCGPGGPPVDDEGGDSFRREDFPKHHVLAMDPGKRYLPHLRDPGVEPSRCADQRH